MYSWRQAHPRNETVVGQQWGLHPRSRTLLELLALLLCSTMREGIPAVLILLFMAVASQIVSASASAPERFVTVSAEGDFVLGCQRFLVAGWNQHALAILIELRSRTKPCCRRWVH